MQAKSHRKNKSAFSSKNSFAESNEKSIEYDMDRYKYSSFLSAIDEDEDHKLSKQRKKNLKLSPITKNNNLNEKLERIKSSSKSPSISRF